MRIVGGRLRGRRLAPFKGLKLRPTSDRVREAVFNILGRDFPFKRVLDLFAGTGAMGIEALSRGAEQAVFVESDPAAAAVIRRNLEACAIQEKARVYRQEVEVALGTLARTHERFDLIFLDPPYGARLTEKALVAIDESGILSPNGMVVAEASKRTGVEVGLSSMEAVDRRRYGDTEVYFFKARG